MPTHVNAKKGWPPMFQPMTWEDTYQLWQYSYYRYRDILSAPVLPETIYVNYELDGYFYGFDWLENVDVQNRKSLISKNPAEFFYSTTPSNKGTIHTAEMLVDEHTTNER